MRRMGIEVRRVAAGERDRVLALVVDSFRADPEVRWWFRTDAEYDACAAIFFGALLDLRTAGGEVWVADGGDAVAMWTPPGGNLLGAEGDAAYASAISTLPADVQHRLEAVHVAVEERLPAEPHWYLGVLASAPERRGQGLAHAVLRPILASADRTRTPVALETATDVNRRYYTRLGFVPSGSFATPGGGPEVHVMLRPPQG